MENKLKVFGVTVLIVIFGLFLPSFLYNRKFRFLLEQ